MDPAPQNRRSATKALLIAVAALILVNAVFLPSLNNFFHGHDDFYWLEKAHDLGELGFLSLLRPHGEMYYRPLNLIFFRLSYGLWGLHPLGYHVVCMIVHLAGCLALFYLMIRIGLEFRVALLAASLYAVSEPMGECVPCISCMHDLAGSLFAVLSAIFVFQWLERGKWWWAALLASLAMALMSKEDTVGVIPALLALALMHRGGGHRPPVHRVWVTFLVAILVTGAYLPCVFVSSDQPGRIAQGIYTASFDGVWLEVSHFLLFAKSMCAFKIGPLQVPTLLLLFVLVGYLILASRDRARIFCAIWVVSTSAPMSFVTQFAGSMVPRYQHLPYLGFAGLVAIGFFSFLDALRSGRLSALGLLSMAALVQVLILGIDPFDITATVRREVIHAPALVGLWLLFCGAWLRGRGLAWCTLVPAVLFFRALAFWWIEGLPWWVGCAGAWSVAAAGVRLARARWPSCKEMAMAGVFAAIAFGPLGRFWLAILAFSMVLGALMLLCERPQFGRWARRAAYVLLVLLMVVAPMCRALRDVAECEGPCRKVAQTAASIISRREQIGRGKGLWISVPSHVATYGVTGLVRACCGFRTDIEVRTVRLGEPHAPGMGVIFNGWGKDIEIESFPIEGVDQDVAED